MNFQVPSYANKNGLIKNEYHCHKGNITYSPELNWNPIKGVSQQLINSL